ncbi:TPA: hypothetical protein JA361_15150 [Legionella pneumophila]|nr:hypothetical protein [Legionella pneumophila]HAT8183524.1 hypothetical protein [Legionella pneumophila]
MLKNAAAKGHIKTRNIRGLMIDGHSKRFVKGTQITIPLTENSDNVPHLDIAPLMQQISHALESHGIRPGKRPVSDAPVRDTPYFSMRNSCIALGESFTEFYLRASEVGSLYNPVLRSNPYAHLIPEENLGPQNIVEHCKAIIDIGGKEYFGDEGKKDLLIIFSFLHQHLNLNSIEPEALNLLLNQMAMGDFSYPDVHALWREGHKTDEIFKELQGVCIFYRFLNNSWTSRGSISFSNRLADGNLRSVFDLLEQKESSGSTRVPTVFFEEYYLKSIHHMIFDVESSDYFREKSDKYLLTYLLSSLKAWPSFSQLMRQHGYDEKDSMSKLLGLINTIRIPSELSQWFLDQISLIPVENNVVLQLYLFKQYLGDLTFYDSHVYTPSLEKALPLVPMLKQSDIYEARDIATRILKDLKHNGLIDKEGKPCPYVIDEYGKMQPVEKPEEDATVSHGLTFFDSMPSLSSSDHGYQGSDEDPRESAPSQGNPMK